MRHSLLETNLPLDALALAAARDQRASVGAPAALQLWWGRRLPSVMRGLLFAAMVEDSGNLHGQESPCPVTHGQECPCPERSLLTGILNDEPMAIHAAREMLAKKGVPRVHDPFCGTGTIPFAAAELGCPAGGSDLNPLAAYVARLALKGISHDLSREEYLCFAADVEVEVREKIGKIYPRVRITKAMAAECPALKPFAGKTRPVEMWTWCRTVVDPNPAADGLRVPLIDNFVISAKKNAPAWVEPQIVEGQVVFTVHQGVAPDGKENGNRISKRGTFASLYDGAPIASDYIQCEAAAGRMGLALMAMVVGGAEGEHVVLGVTKEQVRAAEGVRRGWSPTIPLPGNVRDCAPVNFGAKTYGDVFLPRQALFLGVLADVLVEQAKLNVAWANAVRVFALALGQMASWHSSCSTWWNERVYPRNTFIRPAFSFAWTIAEGNPLEGSTKCWKEIAATVADAFLALPEFRARGTADCADAASFTLDESALIMGEVPYGDLVAYADLADFFYGWMRPVIAAVEPDLARAAQSPREDEIVDFAYRQGSRAAADRFYRERLARALRQCRANQRMDYPALFLVDFRSATLAGRDGVFFDVFVAALLESGFQVTATWPLKDTRSGHVFGDGCEQKFQSLIVVCRPRDGRIGYLERRVFVQRLKDELPAALKDLRAVDAGLEGPSFTSAALGAGLKIATSVRGILASDGKLLGSAEILTEIRAVVDAVAAQEEAATGGAAGCSPLEEVRAALVRGENAETLRAQAFARYEAAEVAGRLDEAKAWNEVLDQWDDLMEETQA